MSDTLPTPERASLGNPLVGDSALQRAITDTDVFARPNPAVKTADVAPDYLEPVNDISDAPAWPYP